MCLALRARSALLAALALVPTAGFAAELPAPVRAMVESAARSGKQDRIEAVVAVARETNPESAAEIDAIVATVASERAAKKEAELKQARFFQNWTGSGQLGASFSTGNSETRNVTAGLSMARDGLMWRHRADFLADIVDNKKGADQERILAGYQVEYRVSERFYALGRLEYERNRQGGIERRFAESVGVGWRAFDGPRARWALEGGPSFRQTLYEDFSENTLAVRGASRFAWTLSNATVLSNDTALFLEKAASINNSAALTSKMFAKLSARLSFNLAWEQEPPAGLESLDTTSRVTLVYDF